MAIKFTDIEPPPKKAKPKKRPAERIMQGLQEALAIAKGEAEPARIYRPRAPNNSFDKKAYMRDYMKQYRRKQKQGDKT